ncbi:HET-domain-containing protein, partial [Cryphonectria parasitica EP155]
YIALSYCWGQREQPMATTTTNLRDRMERGFSLSDMPETIRDAILVTRRLGFRCLWVDSLCILQDFRADKKAEIKKMAGIFEGAFLTIVAASASVVTQGFLSPQHVELPREINSIPVWNHDGRVGRALLQEPGLVRSEPDPIHYRAWTFEELLLSPRRLVYSGRQLIWTCRLPQEPFEMEQDDDSDHAPPFPMAFKDYWAAVLRQYTARTLTHPQDRLVAVQGIVSRLSDITGHQYEAGIWKDYPISSFCWHYDSQGGNEDDLAPANNKVTIPETRDQAIECPTWSWGSVTDPVCLPD